MRVVGEKVSFPSGCPTDSFNDSGTPLLNDFTEPMETDSNVGSLPSVEVDGCSPSLVMGCENRPDSLANEELPDISHSATAAAIPLGFHAGWDSPPNSIYTKANSSGGVTTTQAGVFPGFLHADSYSVSQGASTSGAEQSSFPAQDANLPIDVDTHNESQFRNYVGLVNQAMTCYLNSLLQTLFMTPEFRNALYKWEFQGPQEEESKCIPYQLQKLFVLLQTSDKSALETKELTRSFGWDSSHAWDQHDVQELCRVMFDALEMTWKHTDQADLITNLYQGTMKDYVKCLKCGKENAREDVFLDLPLAVRPFGSQEGYGSVEEALKAFVQPELLDGSNQYFCENCKQKCDAHKGLKITKFPYLLTIQLKRFDFDYTTLHRIKLNDRMSFPSILNLNPFTEERTDSGPNVCSSAEVDSAATTDSGVSVGGSSQSPTVSSTSAEDVVKEDRPVDPYPLIGHEEADDDDEGICLNDAISPSESGKSSPLPKVIEANRLPTTSTDDFIADEFDVAPELVEFYKRQGPNVYELFSIMIHSGSANGGHYYAYIKNMDSTIWWSFNDQHVSMVSPNDIKQSFGGKSNWGYSFSQANAYMLMYRQIAPEKNVHFVSDMKLPPNLLRILERSKEEELHRRLQEEYDRNLLKMNLFCYYPGQCVATEKPYQIAKSLTLAETTVHAYKFLGLDKLGIPFEQCRLIRYNKELFEYSFDAQDMIRPMSDIVGHYFSFDLLMEIVPSHVKFRPYRKEGNSSIQGITMKVYQIDIETESIRNPIMIRVVNSDTVQTLKELIAEYLQCDIRSIFAVLKGYRTEPTQLLDPTETFSSLPCTQKGQVFVEMGTIDRAFPHIPEDSGKVEFPALNTFYEVIDRYENVVVVKVLLPTATDYKSAGFSLGLDFQLENEEMETLSNATTTSELPTFVSAASLLQQHQNVQESDDQSCGPATTSTSSTKSSSFANSTGRRITPLLQPPASDNMSEYSTASDVSATFVTPTESSLPTPDSLSVNTAADQHSLPASAAHYNRPEEIVSPAPSSPSVRIPSPDLSSNMSSPCVGSPNVSPVVSNDGDKIMSYGMMGLLQERLGTDFPLSYDDQEVDHLDGLAEGIEHAEPRGRNLDLELLVEGLSRQSPSAFDRRQQTPHCVSPVASPEPAEGAGGLEPGSPTSVFEEEDRTSAKFNLPPPKSDWTYTADSTAQQTDEAGTSSDSEELKISESDEMSYFKAKEIDQDGSRYLEVEVDRRTPNYVLKHKLVPYVGVPADQFKLVKVYTAYECEWTNMHDQVKSLVNYDSHNSKYRTFEKTNHQLKIKLGRPLKKNEHLIKMFQFTMNDKEYCKELFDVTVKADTSLNQLKLEVKRKMLLHLGQSVPIDRIRIRTKNGIAPKRVLVPETFRKEDESLSTRNDELFVQILSEPECYTGRQDEVLMFCRRWKPDLLVFDPMKEILIPNCTNKEFMQLANAYNFPYETSKLELLESTKWYNLEQLQKSGYIATDDLLSESAFKHDLKDGNLFFYRDGSENPKTLTDQERKELQIKENARLRRSSVSTSVRRERALKIYTGVSPSLEEQDVD